MKQIAYIILLSITLSGCTKEYSFENPLGTGGVVTIGNNCIINRITAFDTLSNRGSSAYNFGFNATGTLLQSANLYDSTTANTIFNKVLIKSTDTLRIDANQYFIIDTINGNRIKQFFGLENPYFAASNSFRYNYTYNNDGKLITKTQQTTNFGTAILTQTDYTYSSNNLITVTSKIPLTNTTFFTASITYDNTKQPKNYLYFFPEANELQPYIGGVNMGSKSVHAPTKIIRKNYNQLTGTFIDSTITTYHRYVYSNDNYVLSVDATGYDIPASPLLSGRNKFGYFCR